MIRRLFKSHRWMTAAVAAYVALAVGASQPVWAQTVPSAHTQAPSFVLQGHVRDASGKSLTGAIVSLRCLSKLQAVPSGSAAGAEFQETKADADGAYRFSGLPEGTYLVEGRLGKLNGTGRIELEQGKSGPLDLVLIESKQPEFFDEPQFTVAGVTQATGSGGHGSDNVLRASEALVKATGSLSDASATEPPAPNGPSARESLARESLKRERNTLRQQVASAGSPGDEHSRKEQAPLHHRLAQLDEKFGDPLEAVHEYQRAAELDPSELHLFDWATELLTHRALEPATEVFTQGNHRFPQSKRMLIGLSVAWYARGSYERASKFLAAAADLAPSDPAPYLFMGKMLSVEASASKEILDHLARFQSLKPDNAEANYYYAVCLLKAPAGDPIPARSDEAQVEALLQKSVRLDPKFAAAHLELGKLYARLGDNAHAISAYEKAIEADPTLEEAHYRLAQAYRRAGKEAEAKRELQLHEELAKASKQDAERRRREIQEFVISLRD